MTVTELPLRAGPRPRTTPTNPHTQLDQIAPRALQDALAAHMFASRPCVEQRASVVSVPGARAMWLSERCPAGERSAFLTGREFCHLHPPSDGSLHLALPPELAALVVERGWGEPHPVALRGLLPRTILMVYGPRDEAELEVVKGLVDASCGYAHA